MTGFGRAEASVGAASLTVEARSVNNRYLAVKIRAPARLARLEPAIEEDVRAVLARGSVEVSIRISGGSRPARPSVDTKLAQAYLEAIDQVRAATRVEGAVDLALLLGLPGVVNLDEIDELQDAEASEIRAAVRAALDAMVRMRADEGARTTAELERIAQRVRGLVADLEARADALPDEYRKRVNKRLDALLANAGAPLDAGVLEREVAVLADRSDVREELSRLDSHLEAFAAGLRKRGPVGRTLDFVVQEMGREANTIGSKSQDAFVAQRVIELKTEIERLREQVQNLE